MKTATAPGDAEPTPTRRVTRRRFVGTLVSIPALLGLYAWRVEPHWLEIVHRDLPIAGLPVALRGRTLAQVSDLHIGPEVDDDYIVHSFRRLAALEPDIVVHTGDLISFRDPDTIKQAERVLADFPRGRLGSIAILGNHDYGRTWVDAGIAAGVERALSNAGATVLRNARTQIAGLNFIGFEDLWSGRFAPAQAFRGFDFAAPGVVLCHNPDACDLHVWQDFRGWTLAGHTHGGQCKPPFLPPPVLPVINSRYTAGEFTLNERRQLYINRGVGHLMRVRFNVRPEITMFRLMPA